MVRVVFWCGIGLVPGWPTSRNTRFAFWNRRRKTLVPLILFVLLFAWTDTLRNNRLWMFSNRLLPKRHSLFSTRITNWGSRNRLPGVSRPDPIYPLPGNGMPGEPQS